MKKERSVATQLFLPKSHGGILDVSAAAQDLMTPPGRYKLPISLHQKLALQLQSKLYEQLSADNAFVFGNVQYPIPSNWQAVVAYLHGKGVLQHSTFSLDQMQNDDPKVYGMRIWAKLPEHLTDGYTGGNFLGYSRGVAWRNFSEAISKVLGEFLERYPLTVYKNNDLIRASIDDLIEKKMYFLDPRKVAQPAAWQKEKFPEKSYSEKSLFQWCVGHSLTENRKALMPAQLVFWNYRRAEGEALLQQPITNGAGGMFSYEEAVLAGLYELIQRDAFLIRWLKKIPPASIDKRSIQNSDVQRIIQDCERYDLEVHIFETTSDIPIRAFVAAIIDRTGKGPALALGGGCGKDPIGSIERSLTEALGVRSWLRQFDTPYPELSANYEPFTEELGQRERLLLWGNPNILGEFDFFMSGPKQQLAIEPEHARTNEIDPKQELTSLVEMLKNMGSDYEVFVYNARQEILDELGYFSVKVCVPPLVPLYLRENYAPLGAYRIENVMKGLGLLPSNEVNTFPHPFP